MTSEKNHLENGTFDECSIEKCPGFKINDQLDTMFLCSMKMDYYSSYLDPNKNYIGFTFAAVKKDGVWYYNNGNSNNHREKYR